MEKIEAEKSKRWETNRKWKKDCEMKYGIEILQAMHTHIHSERVNQSQC